MTISSARGRPGTATARPCTRPCCSVVGTPGSRYAGRMNGQCGHDTAADLAQHVSDSGAGETQHARGQTDAGQQRNGRDRRAALLENHGEIQATERVVAVGAGDGEFGPAEVDDRLPHRPPALGIRHRLPRDCRRALGAQDVTHAVTQRQLTRIQSDVHKAPNIIKIVN